jgi:hypothetical protein
MYFEELSTNLRTFVDRHGTRSQNDAPAPAALTILSTIAIDDQLLRLRGDAAAMRVLWAREDLFANVFRRALEVAAASDANGRSDLRTAARAFLDTTYLLLVSRPSDVVDLASALDEGLAVGFLKDFVHSTVAQNNVMSGIALQPDLFARLPLDGGWVEVVVLVHGMGLLNSAPERRFTIAELTPLGIDVDRPASRAVLSSALDNNQLDPTEAARLLQLFPSDAYFRSKVGRP